MSSSSIVTTIEAIAQQYGVDPRLAIADAYVESGLNPTAEGDNGSSFGLYQLHQGGELGNLSPQQAFDPATNATVALSNMGQIAQQNPGASPGEIAALAQRPANPSAYAAQVNQVYDQLGSGTNATLDGSILGIPTPIPGNWNIGPNLPADAGKAAAKAAGSAIGPVVGTLWSAMDSFIPRAIAILLGLVLLVVGIKVLFGGGGGRGPAASQDDDEDQDAEVEEKREERKDTDKAAEHVVEDAGAAAAAA